MCGRYQEQISAAACFATETGALLVEDGRDSAISEGAGTIAMELSGWPSPFDAVVVPLGDGGLLAGIACWIKAHTPNTRLIGVCATGAPAMRLAWRHRQVISAPCSTIADALAVQTPFPEALARLQASTDEILLVDDAALVQGMRLAHHELGLVLEPAGYFMGRSGWSARNAGVTCRLSPARLPTVALSSQVIDSRPARPIMRRHGGFTIVSEEAGPDRPWGIISHLKEDPRCPLRR